MGVMGKAVALWHWLCYACCWLRVISFTGSNLDRYVWLSLFLWSNSFIEYSFHKHIPRTCVYCLCLIWSIITVLVFQTKLSGTFWRFQVDSKPQAENHNSFTCLESSYPVIRVTWPVRWVGAWLHVLYISYYIWYNSWHQHLRFSFQAPLHFLPNILIFSLS